MSASKEIWHQASVPINSTIGDVISNLDTVAIKIVLVVDGRNKLVGTISDGDVRRGLLKGLDMSSPIANIVHQNPLVVPLEMGREMVKQLMEANKFNKYPSLMSSRSSLDCICGMKSQHSLVDLI